ncbi:hypothetical protein OIU77_015450 [Salix suchowensis]|uniref:Kinesin motor domain-containing protein n=1 Tax=Salix suchowensis TaxID=1278906 RepID=A0ABQ8ZH02_9ROSI|nr:hypothetical protein OIU77_015450 [Salix suchowensis]
MVLMGLVSKTPCVKFSTVFQTFNKELSPDSSFELLPQTEKEEKLVKVFVPGVSINAGCTGGAVVLGGVEFVEDDCFASHLIMMLQLGMDRKGDFLFTKLLVMKKVVSSLDIYAQVGANKPLVVSDLKAFVEGDEDLLIRFEGFKDRDLVKFSKISNFRYRRSSITKTYENVPSSRMRIPEKKGINRNKVLELKGNIRVFCRCRSLKPDEVTAGALVTIDFESAKDGELKVMSNGLPRKTFKFDAVFGPQANQADVFEDTASFSSSILDGYNVCVFAHGQTGTGKTFTMEGTEEDRGVNFRTLEQVFRMIKEREKLFR